MERPQTWKELEDLLDRGAAPEAITALMPRLEREGGLEQALAILLARHPPRPALAKLFREALSRQKPQRQAQLHFDPNRVLLRVCYARRAPLAAGSTGAFSALLLDLCLRAGLEPSLSLEKQARPLLHLGYPLPPGAEGLREHFDLCLARAPREPALLESLNRHAPEGLRFLSATLLPPHATPVLELARRATWVWPCPAAILPSARAAFEAFTAAEQWSIRKGGKEGGQKVQKEVEVRSLVESLEWEGSSLRLNLRILQGNALNPARLVAGVVGLEPASVTGLVRECVELAEDPKLSHEERFQPKLKNMFEDAVLLREEGNLRILEEDDEDPLVLG
ncbi:MAG: DUF2344 domain-containing protein [Acidobacteria bacterium]|nr:DUF2344 domain-containing protein [Acidobacteriota bacterium]